MTLSAGATSFLLKPLNWSTFGRHIKHILHLAGARVTAIHPFASVVEGTPLVMALLSYAGRMEIGIDTDPEAIPDPHGITELFLAALDELESLPIPP